MCLIYFFLVVTHQLILLPKSPRARRSLPLMSRSDKLNALETLLNENFEGYYPEPENYKSCVFTLPGNKLKYKHCTKCFLPKAFFHLSELWDDLCDVDSSYHCSSKDFLSVTQLLRKNKEVLEYEEAVKLILNAPPTPPPSGRCRGQCVELWEFVYGRFIEIPFCECIAET